MTKDKKRNQNGNVFIYILIAVGLLGALMFAMSKSASQNDAAGELSEGESKIAASEIIAYATSTTNALAQMQQTGATLSWDHTLSDNLKPKNRVNFMLPADDDFELDDKDHAPNIYKLFHPDGGGLNYKTLPAKAVLNSGSTLKPGYYIGRFNNIEWTPTTAQDVVFAAYEIKESVCKALNKAVTGNTTIPTVSGESLQNLFVYDDLHTGTNDDFMITNCTACEEISALCVTDGSGKYTFYSILEAE